MASSIRHWLPCSPLGSGSFSSVSLAINLSDGLPFAVKSVSHLHALHNELLILQSLHSPRILRCLGSDDSHNLFLEYIPGGSLADVVKQSTGGKLDERRVRLYTREILEGLQYLHEQGIVHCDIKGQNVLVGSSGIKIADFGAAKRWKSVGQEQEIRGCEPRGTPLWMAPEVVRGVEQSPSSDIWSLGCTVVEMLQGRPPWTNTSSLDTVLSEIAFSQEDVPLPELASSEAKNFLRKCLQRDQSARWTAAQLLDHPFVKTSAVDDCDCPPRPKLESPRSILDFSGEGELCESELKDWVPNLCLPSEIAKRLKASTASKETHSMYSMSSEFTPMTKVCSREANKDDWITVRCVDGWCEDKQKPFMEGWDGNLVQVKKGEEVNLESAKFLKNRKRKRS